MKNIMILPNVVCLTEDHSPFGVTRSADFTESRLTTRTLQAVDMPVLVERVEQEAIHDFVSASGASLHCALVVCPC